MKAPKTVNLEEIREAVANYMNSEGCSCCRGSSHVEHQEAIAKLLSVPQYKDKSGYNFTPYETKEK